MPFLIQVETEILLQVARWITQDESERGDKFSKGAIFAAIEMESIPEPEFPHIPLLIIHFESVV